MPNFPSSYAYYRYMDEIADAQYTRERQMWEDHKQAVAKQAEREGDKREFPLFFRKNGEQVGMLYISGRK